MLMFCTLQAQYNPYLSRMNQLQDYSVNCCYTDRRNVNSVSTCSRYFCVSAVYFTTVFLFQIPVQRKEVLVSDDVERECLKTSNNGSGSHTSEK
jgi:hypothetical protein